MPGGGRGGAARLPLSRSLTPGRHAISRGIQASARLAFCSAIFFSLETFPDFPNFFGNRKEVLEALMTMGELFAVAILSSVIFALAAHWQNDSDGGLT
jgi:hypothetical protein